ncbi:MAG: glycine cleavage system protein T [Verrucomicrobia bacterium]|nr:MAG: glycine cleavage system protein T [Verrucomicrobiota bacterium]
MKRTPLFGAHQKLGAKLIEFSGWEMPVHYTSIMEEHLAVRRAAGLFDISHMGQVSFTGPAAQEFLNRTLTNDTRKLAVGQGQYTLMCNPRGGVIDDLYVYRLEAEEYLLIVNAARIGADVKWLEQQRAVFGEQAGVRLLNASEMFGAVALQGPSAATILSQLLRGGSAGGTRVTQVSDLKKNQTGRWNFNNHSVWVSRTGYTGEDGFELVAPAALIEGIWDKLIALGMAHGLKPAGLGARDTLRTEVCYPLYGHELDESTTPMEAGLGYFVALDKGEFVGRDILATQKAQGTNKKLIAFKMSGKSAPPRPEYPIWSAGPEGEKVGEVASGTQSPSLGVGIGLGYVPTQHAVSGTALEIEIRGKRSPCAVVPKPIYRKSSVN